MVYNELISLNTCCSRSCGSTRKPSTNPPPVVCVLMTNAGPYLDSRTRIYFCCLLNNVYITPIVKYNTHRCYLHIRQTNIKHLVRVGKPHQPHIGQHKCAQIPLVARQIPNARHRAHHLLARQHTQLAAAANHGAAQLQVTVQRGRLVQTVHLEHSRELACVVQRHVGEDELEARMVVRGEDVQSLGGAAQLGEHGFRRHRRYA